MLAFSVHRIEQQYERSVPVLSLRRVGGLTPSLRLPAAGEQSGTLGHLRLNDSKSRRRRITMS